MLNFSEFTRVNESHPYHKAYSPIYNPFSGAAKDSIKEYSDATDRMGANPKALKKATEQLLFAPTDIETSALTIRFFKENGVYTFPAAEIFFELFKVVPDNLLDENFPLLAVEEVIDNSNRTFDKFKVFLNAQEKSQKFNRDKFLSQRPDSKFESIRVSYENKDKILGILEKILSIKSKLVLDDPTSVKEDEMEILTGMFSKLLEGGKGEILSKLKSKSPKMFAELSKIADESALDDTMTLGDLGFDD